MTDAVAPRLQRALGDGFRLERELGGGGMSRVFLAHEIALARDVVVKVLPEDVAEGISRERFRREVLLSANLQHPNIVGVIAAGDADGLPYFVMPFVDGESLRDRLTSDGALSIAHTVSVLRDVARALAFAHERGVVHRDIKPDNVLLAGGAAIVADFGVAKALVTSRRRREHPHGTLTTAGISLGTPAYMAPEQVAGDPATDHRADLYALGVMTFEMLAGHTPFAGRGVTEMMQAHLVEPPPPIATVRPGVPDALAAIVMRCLAKEPARRPADADEILRLLDDPAVVSGAVSSTAVRSLPAQRGVPRGWRRLAVVSGIAAAGVAAAAAGIAVALRPAAPVAPAATVASAPRGVAVLPMVSVSPDSSDAYLALGMTDEITGALSRIPGLRVASRSAAASAQAGGGSVADVARRLGVAYLLEGTVQRSGDRLRVAVRLVDASDGFSAWSEVYERSTMDLLAVQSDIATQIAAAVQDDVAGGAAPAEEGAPAAMQARDPQAYNDYLRGRYLFSRRGNESVSQAIAAFESAIARDPAFARAYAELAQAYSVLPLYEEVEGEEAAQKARFAAERALALDSTLSSAHAALGNLLGLQWRWGEGRAALQRAVALDSTDYVAVQWLGENLLANGDTRGALAALSVAVRRNPDAAIPRAMLAMAQSADRAHEAAIATARTAVQRDSTLSPARVMLATVLLNAGRAAEAVRELEAFGAAASDQPLVLGVLGLAYGRAGRTADAQAILRRLEAMSSRPGAFAAVAKVHLGLGEVDRGLDALTWATASRDAFFTSETLASPIFDPLRADPRFARVLGIIGLDVASLTRTGR